MTRAALTGALRAAVDDWAHAPAPLPITGGVQAYAWGQRNGGAVIPRLLGIAPAADRPYAELWLGAHPLLPATVNLGGAAVSLADVIAAAPAVALGAGSTARFGPELPFLMKVLAAERPLSIQAHPTQAQAQAGFDREDAAGVPRDAPHRIYRDRNHKPELILALDDFHALLGFRPPHEIAALVGATPELGPVLGGGPGGDTRAWLKALFARCFDPADVAVASALGALMARLETEDRARPFARDRVEHWILRAARSLGNAADRGLLAFFLLNLVRLIEGQALFLGAGEPHAYLEGVGVEVMANSDNVLRGGLTPKHVDVAALLDTLTFDAGPPRILTAAADGAYPTPAAEFITARLALRAGESREIGGARGADVVLMWEGQGFVAGVPARAGAAFFVPAALGAYRMTAESGPLLAFRSSVPQF
ncbi:MAG TPA: mannose-6-phosphate isomerase, class I [Polyangia bacterium]|nr:mannose-6-phosphate isomerase, class I [Polyangia bacterium]